MTTPFKLTKTNSMKTLVKTFFTFCVSILLLSGLDARTYVWTGLGSDDLWSNPDNWRFGNMDPVLASDLPMGTGDDVQIPSGIGIPQLTMNENIGSILITNNGLNLNSFSLSAGSLTISNGSISNGDFIISNSSNVTGGSFTSVNISSGTWTDLTGAIFSGSTTITKTGTSNDGNAVDDNTFLGDFTFNQTSGAGGNIRFGNSSPNTYGGNTVFNNNVSGGSSLVTISESGVSSFSGNLTVNNGSTGGVEIGNAAGGPINVVDFIFSSSAGPVIIRNIEESGSGGSVSITSGTTLDISDVIFSGNINATVSGLCEITGSDFNGAGPHSVTGGEINQVGNCLFAGDVTFENGMGGDCPWTGGNTFQGSATFTKTAANNRNWRLDDISSNAYSGDITLNDNGTGFFTFAEQGFSLSNANLTLNGPTGGKDAGGSISLTNVPTIAGSGEWQATSLSITNNSGNIDIGPSFYISGSSFSLTNTIANMTSAGTITLNDNTPFSGGGPTSFINGGFLQKLGETANNSTPNPFVFHVGDENFYAPFSYSTDNAGGNPEVTVRYIHSKPSGSNPYSPSGTLSQTERWEMSVLVTSLGNTLVTLPYGPQSGVIGDENDLRVAFAAPSSSTFTDIVGAASGGFIEADIPQAYNAGAGSYTFTLGSINAAQTPLPVELVFFKAIPQEDQVTLKWATANELNNDYFQVERSSKGSDFQAIGAKIDGAGTTSEPLNYEFIDTAPLEGIAYYRLKQVDFDGRYDYSDVVAVQIGEAAAGQMQVFPNPVQDQLQVRWGGEQNIDQLRLLNLRGQELPIDVLINDKQAEVNLQRLPKGVYVLELLSGQERIVQRIVK